MNMKTQQAQISTIDTQIKILDTIGGISSIILFVAFSVRIHKMWYSGYMKNKWNKILRK